MPAPAPERRTVGSGRAIQRDLDAPSTWPLLDSLRGATVLAVVGWHVYRLTATGFSAHAVPFYFWPLGVLRLGVDVFFVLSGFLVIRSWRSVRAGVVHGTAARRRLHAAPACGGSSRRTGARSSCSSR